ncbi:MAG: response regulator [Gemmatimonadetes bacterium]|nr:response regulator [Gemmatimonadota bacterium]
MPDSDALIVARGTEDDLGVTSPPEGPSPAALVEEGSGGIDRGRERLAIYWTLVVLLTAGSVLLRNDPQPTGLELHTVMESIATVLAFIVGGLALVRFYSRKQATFLFIGTGFIGAGVLDLNQTLLTAAPFLTATGTAADDIFVWSWTTERVFLSLFLLLSLLAWRREVKEGADGSVHEGSVYVAALALTFISLLFFQWAHLHAVIRPGHLVPRPLELVPGLLFGLTFFGFLAKGDWRRDTFEHWLLISLLIAAMAHVGFMSMSEHRFDGMFNAAHLLKLASYVSMLTGLLFSVYLTFRREGRVLAALTEANEALAHEVSVRTRTEQAVKEGRTRLQEFLDNANDLVQSVDREGRFLYVNRAWKRTLGYTDRDLESRSLFDIVHPASRNRLKEEFERVFSGAPSRRFSIELVAADSRIVMLSGSTAAQRVRGEAVATQSIFRDVTQQRLAERQLADSKANLTALVENTGDGIWSVDREHRLITFNSAFALSIEAATGREPAVGRLPRETFNPEDIDFYEELYDRALRGERHVALRTERVGSQTMYFELYANPIQGEEGITGAVFFGKDVTPRVRAEEAMRVAKDEAEAANKAKSHFLANMSHELRTPLNSVIGFTNVLLKNKDQHLTEKDVGFLQRVLANGKHLLELINDVLDLAKVEAGRMDLLLEPVDLRHLVVETVQQLEGQARVKEGVVTLVAEAPEGLDSVETDAGKLKQVIINLVGNALKFTHHGTVTVRVDVGPDGRTPTGIAVKDTGIGIPPDRLEAIFDAFQQAEAGTARKYGGTGLGLAISRSMCLLMGFDLVVDSEPGEGSTFTIVMGQPRLSEREAPLSPDGEATEREAPRPEAGTEEREAAAALAGAGATTAPAAPGSTHELAVPGETPSSEAPRRSGVRDFKVLVVDDESDSRVLLAHHLEEFGCQVAFAADGEAGIAAAREQRPDLITLDLIMPGMTGWEALRELKADQDLRHIPVVVVSIAADEGRGRLLGAVDLVKKPVEREDLLRVLWRNLVRTRGGRILVVDDDAGSVSTLEDYLDSMGLEVVTARDGRAGLDAVGTEAPDAVLLDLAMPGMNGIEFLRTLRANPLHSGLPVIVLTSRELTSDEQKILEDLASGVLDKGEGLESRLREALESMFTLRPSERVTS